MATIFTHALAATALNRAFTAREMPARFWVLTALCAIIPDADVAGFAFGIRYQDTLGHRGLTHSLLFAFLLGCLVVTLAVKDETARHETAKHETTRDEATKDEATASATTQNTTRKSTATSDQTTDAATKRAEAATRNETRFKRWPLVIFFFIATASHGLLDALTNGGLGVAFFSPFDRKRYFLTWRPIEVSPIGIGFFSRRGVEVLFSEIVWVWLPSLSLVLLAWLWRRVSRRRTSV